MSTVQVVRLIWPKSSHKQSAIHKFCIKSENRLKFDEKMRIKTVKVFPKFHEHWSISLTDMVENQLFTAGHAVNFVPYKVSQTKTETLYYTGLIEI